MLHLGDITKINGHNVPIVDCVIGGSPCQDLSVAGKRAGLDGERKGKKKQSSDAARYKALGNSIALPPWKWVLKRLCACYERDATMCSLFSGIGGFDLLWTQINGPDSVLWESEIEEFPSAVCRRHFGDEAMGEKGDYYEFFN